ncbi:MAG: deoxyribodipyrimidine photolyase, partial [Planctomycetaceae bacterium]|nr:deoxyribodipyrimidine photolyase [Planctomycetaceae bacterium]
MAVHALRLRPLNEKPIRSDGRYVLYWMTTARRLRDNFALQRAVDHAEELGLPLLIFEALRCDYPWASMRLHRFVIQGMLDNRQYADQHGVCYFSYVEPTCGHARGLLNSLADQASIIVTDDFPCFFLPKMTAAAAAIVDVRMESVDSNGLLPLDAADRAFPSAYAFRRFLQKSLPHFLHDFPEEHPLSRPFPKSDCLPTSVARQWELTAGNSAEAVVKNLRSLPIDHSVSAAPFDGGSRAALGRLKDFLQTGLPRYGVDRSHPDNDPSSGLSPYLHFGHIAAHRVFAEIAAL